MNQISNFFGTPQAQVRPIIQPQVARPIRNDRKVLEENTVNQGHQFVPHIVEQERPREVVRFLVLMVNLDQDADQVVQKVRQENLVEENNLAAMLERIIMQNGVNMGLKRPTTHLPCRSMYYKMNSLGYGKSLSLPSSLVIPMSQQSNISLDI